jgi:hypothetical protein
VKVKSPFRNSFLKCEFKYGREDLFRVDFFKKYFIYLVEKNSIRLTTEEKYTFMEKFQLPKNRIPKYSTSISLFSRYASFIEQYFDIKLVDITLHEMLNQQYWFKFFNFAKTKLKLEDKTLQNNCDDILSFTDYLTSVSDFHTSNLSKISAFIFFCRTLRKSFNIGATRDCTPNLAEGLNVKNFKFATQLEAGGLLTDSEMPALFKFLLIHLVELKKILTSTSVDDLKNNPKYPQICFFSQGIFYHTMAVALYGQRSQINEGIIINRFSYNSSSKVLTYFPTIEKVFRKGDGIVIPNWALLILYLHLQFIRPFLLNSQTEHFKMWVTKKGAPITGSLKTQMINFFSNYYNCDLKISESRSYRRNIFTKYVNGELDCIMEDLGADVQSFARALEIKFNVSQNVMYHNYNRRLPEESQVKFSNIFFDKFISKETIEVGDVQDSIPMLNHADSISTPQKRNSIILSEEFPEVFICQSFQEKRIFHITMQRSLLIVKTEQGFEFQSNDLLGKKKKIE